LAQQGLATTQFNLGFMYEQGRGVVKNEAKAVEWYQQAAAQGRPVAYQRLGKMYEYGHGVVQNLAEAQRWYAKAAATLSPDSDNHTQVLTAQQRVARQLAPAQTFSPPPSPPTPAVSTATLGQPRRALVIGNAAYPDSPLANSVNDATDIADLLRRLGFDVTLQRDADRPTMEKAVDLFTRGVPRGSAGLFFSPAMVCKLTA
jgi:hypothetical protein